MLQTICAILFITIIAGLAIFQILLCLGKPYGNYAWGGSYKILPIHLRVASAASVLLYGIFALIAADAAGWIELYNGKVAIIGLSIYMTIGIIMNAVSRSTHERYTMTPIVAILAACCWLLAIA